MKTAPLLLSSVLLLGGAFSTAYSAGSFAEISEHLDLDGTFVTYIDFDGDGQELGERLNVIYQKVAETNPDVPPFPLDFPAIFETLGFGSIRSVGASSMELEDGLFRNRSVTLLQGEPAGLLRLYGLEPTPFRAAEIAPADATTVISGRIDVSALRDTVVALLSQVMGPMGEGMAVQGLQQPIAGTDVTGEELISALSQGMDLIMSQSFEAPAQPEIKAWLSLHGAGSLLPRLEPLFESMGIQFVDTGDGRVADLSFLMQQAPIGLLVKDPADSDDLILYTDAEWVAGFENGGERLSDTAAYQRVTSRLPKDAALYAYSAGVDLEQLFAALEGNPQVAAYLPVARDSVDLLLGGLLAPSASATFRRGDAIVTEGYGAFSYKDALFAVPAGVLGVGAGVAAAQKTTQAPDPDAPEDGWEEDDGADAMAE